MEFELVPALVAGVAGGALMLILRVVLRAAGADLRMDLPAMWGTLLRLDAPAARRAGLAVHAVASVVIAVLYAIGLRLLGATDGLLLWGAVGGLVHWLGAALFLAIVPPVPAAIPEGSRAPGPFARGFGVADVLAFLAGHLLYGAAVGAAYGLLHSRGGPALVV